MLIIFDCDGVLRSVSWEVMYEAYLATAKYINRDPADFWLNASDFRKWHDNDWHYNFERMGIPRGSDYLPLTLLFHEIYDPSIIKFHWVEEVLISLAKKGHTLAVLSGAKFQSVHSSLGESVNHFATIKGADHVKNLKPHPEGIHLIMEELGMTGAEVVMIGDSQADIVAGKEAGVLTVGVTWGMADLETMEQLMPDYIFHDPQQLKSL